MATDLHRRISALLLVPSRVEALDSFMNETPRSPREVRVFLRDELRVADRIAARVVEVLREGRCFR